MFPVKDTIYGGNKFNEILVIKGLQQEWEGYSPAVKKITIRYSLNVVVSKYLYLVKLNMNRVGVVDDDNLKDDIYIA